MREFHASLLTTLFTKGGTLMTVITVSRELGSNGAAIAEQVAAEMGYRFVTKAILEKVLHQYGLVRLNELYEKAPGLWARVDFANLELVSMLDKVIQGIAHLDNVVLLGRGGYAALSGYTNVLNVRVQAPLSVRVKRVMELEGLTDVAEAEKLIEQNDKARAMFVQGFYGVDFYNSRQFQLVLDTGITPSDTAAAWIIETARSLAAQPFSGAKTTLDIVVDKVMEDAIKQVLMMAGA